MKNLERILLLLPVLFFVLTCSKDSGDDSDYEPPIKYTLTVTITPPGGGTVSPAGGSYDKGTQINLEPTPSAGYAFKEWAGDLQGTGSPFIFLMNSDMNVTAVFELLDSDADGVPDLDDDCPSTPEGVSVDENGCPTTPPIYLDENGITIKCYDWANVGDTGMVNGVMYTVVDENTLRNLVFNNEDVTNVCTTKVTNMEGMFAYEPAFNQDISSWDVSNVTDMSYMFLETSFDQDIGAWDVSSVTSMYWMFMFSPFNQDIGQWDVSNVTNMQGMFSETPFNQDIGAWDVSNVTDMSWMFELSDFNQDIGAWDVSSVTDMWAMFSEAPFNQDISAWDVSSVTDMSLLFLSTPFNQDISSWNVAQVTDMSGMFALSSFNQDISSWNVSSVTFMGGMFYESVFDQPIVTWDVSNVEDMEMMFYGATAFNQDLSGWEVAKVVSCADFSTNTPQWVLPKPNFTNCSPDPSGKAFTIKSPPKTKPERS
jgi:surface protein